MSNLAAFVLGGAAMFCGACFVVGCGLLMSALDDLAPRLARLMKERPL